MLQTPDVKYLSVSDLSRALSVTLEQSFPEVFFKGEISEISRPASGHIYFTVKDEKSQLSAVMWRGMASSLSFDPKPGIAVVCHGKPNLYNVTGKLQIVVHFMSPAGEGLLQKKFLELKAKLEREGLFAEERKRKIPFFPLAVGIVSSASGAVIHDIMVRFAERMPHLKVFLADVRVQGEGAAAEIAQAIEHFNALANVDVIIVARGGGSLEDLWAFNEERTVRAIFASKIPIVSGIGHEVDVTLADLAADLRAPTPTAAAEMVIPHKKELLRLLDGLLRRLADYERWHAPLVQRVDEVSMRLSSAVKGVLKHAAVTLEASRVKVKLLEPLKLLGIYSARVDLLRGRLEGSSAQTSMRLRNAIDTLERRLCTASLARVRESTHRFERLIAKLQAISPRAVLKRGYSIVQRAGTVITDAGEVQEQDSLQITLARGEIGAKVQKITR